MLFLVLSVTDFRLCVQLLSGDTNKMLSSANLKAVLCFLLDEEFIWINIVKYLQWFSVHPCFKFCFPLSGYSYV